MFDMFGLSKVDAQSAIREIANGVTTGLIEAYTWQISEKDREIQSLKENIANNEVWKQRYDELSKLLELKKQEVKQETTEHVSPQG
jgi:hypothetical protein